MIVQKKLSRREMTVIQSRKWNHEMPELLDKQLNFEFLDTLFSMIVGIIAVSFVALNALLLADMAKNYL